MKNKDLWIYRISTGMFSAVMLMSIVMYFTRHDEVAVNFQNYGFPVWLIYPLAIAKLLGLIAVWSNASTKLKEWAYAGFTFNVLLALGAHIAVTDAMFAPALICLIAIAISVLYNSKMATGK